MKVAYCVGIIAAVSIFGCRNTASVANTSTAPSQTSVAPVLPIGNRGPLTVPSFTPSSCHYQGSLPDPNCTPGAINPDVTQDNLETTVCKSGWTATIRPPVNYTSALERAQIAEYGAAFTSNQTEEDHLVSLELGGAPWDPRNLFPQPYSPSPGAHEKDRVENYLHEKICAMPNVTANDKAARFDALRDAQVRIAKDWVAIWRTLP